MPKTDVFEIRRKIIGVLLQGARLKAGRTKRECADAIGASVSVLTEYEEGHKDVSLPELELLAFFLHAPVSGFLEGEDDSLVNLDTPPGPEVIALRNRIIGALLRQAREQKGRTLKELAQTIHCTPRRIGQYEAGQIAIPLPQLEMLSEELGLPLSHFFNDGIGTVGERELKDRQYEAFESLPEDIRAFVIQPSSLAYLRTAMYLSQMPADTIRNIAAGLLEITY